MDIVKVQKALIALQQAVDGAEPAISIRPEDCTDACGDADCNCSGVFRAMAWTLNPDDVQKIIDDLREGT